MKAGEQALQRVLEIVAILVLVSERDVTREIGEHYPPCRRIGPHVRSKHGVLRVIGHPEARNLE